MELLPLLSAYLVGSVALGIAAGRVLVPSFQTVRGPSVQDVVQ